MRLVSSFIMLSQGLVLVGADGWRAQGYPVKPASGLGPGAYYIDADLGLNFLAFGKGKRLLTLGVYTDRKRDVKAAQALAKAVYAKL